MDDVPRKYSLHMNIENSGSMVVSGDGDDDLSEDKATGS